MNLYVLYVKCEEEEEELMRYRTDGKLKQEEKKNKRGKRRRSSVRDITLGNSQEPILCLKRINSNSIMQVNPKQDAEVGLIKFGQGTTA